MLTFLLKVCFYFSIELTVSSLSRMEGLQIKLATPNATSLSLPEDLLYFGIERHRQHKKRKANNFDKRQSLSCKTASRLECFGKRNRVKSCLCNEQCLLGYEDGLAAATTDSTLLKEKKKFYVAVFLPLPQKNTLTTDLQSIWCALHQATNYVNNNVFGEKEMLSLETIPTECHFADVMQSLFGQMFKRPETLAVIGPLCYNVTRSLARTVQWWDVIQISFNINEIELSNDELYRTFVRTVPSVKAELDAIANFMQYYNWTVIDVVYSSSQKWVENYNQLISTLEDQGMKVGSSLRMNGKDDKILLNRLTKSRNNIKLFMGTEGEARRLFCEIYLSYPNLLTTSKVWIFSGNFDGVSWWSQSNRSCSVKEMTEALSKHIRVGVKRAQSQGETLQENYQDTKSADFAYDTILAVAFSIKSALQETNTTLLPADLQSNQSSQNNLIFNEKVLNAFENIHFSGKTGEVSFSEGERIGVVYFEQFRTGKYVLVGQTYNDNLSVKENVTIWPGGRFPPLSSTEKRFQIDYLSPVTVYFVISLSILGTILACAFLFFNITHRKHKIIKMSSPYLNNVIGAGCILAYASLIMAGLETKYVQDAIYGMLCKLRLWLISFAFTLAFGTMFLKTWRIHEIFTNVSVKTVKLKDYKLFIMLGVFLSIDAFILTTWLIVDPVTRFLVNSPREILENRSFIVIWQMEQCYSNYLFWWIGAISIYKGILLVFGVFLAWETRQVKVQHLNDSTYIGVSVYVTVVSCVIGSATSFALKNYTDLAFIFTSLSIYVCTTAVLCLVFVPNIVALICKKRNVQPGSSPKLFTKIKERSPKPQPRITNGKNLTCQSGEALRKLVEEKESLEKLLHQNMETYRDEMQHCDCNCSTSSIECKFREDNQNKHWIFSDDISNFQTTPCSKA